MVCEDAKQKVIVLKEMITLQENWQSDHLNDFNNKFFASSLRHKLRHKGLYFLKKKCISDDSLPHAELSQIHLVINLK